MKTIIAVILATMLWQPATVTNIDGDIISVEIEDGNIYEFYGEGFEEGEDIEVFKVMDVIVDVR